MYNLLKKLFPICRSITGNGVRETLRILSEVYPIKTYEVLTGTKAFDWTVPKEWNIKEGWIAKETVDKCGGNLFRQHWEKIIDFKENNLHVMGYSTPVNKSMNLEELQPRLYSLEKQPDAIPYVTSYYKERWGFCLTHNQRKKLTEGSYNVYIDSELKDGSLTYGEIIIPGKEKKEILLSTYICHPSMANNELSGPVVTINLAKWLASKQRRYTYRIVFVPETIGSIVYLSRNYKAMKKNTIAGYVITCVGDDSYYSYLYTRDGNTLSDKAAMAVLKGKGCMDYPYTHRGSDERQYNSPGIDLPIGSIMRSKYGTYKEYHTSLDNLDYVSEKGLNGSLEAYKQCIDLIERNRTYKTTCLCEPQLGKRGLYETLSTKNSGIDSRNIINVLAYADGKHDLIDMYNKTNIRYLKLYKIVDVLLKYKLIKE